MSFTYTPKPSTTRQTGSRGRGRGASSSTSTSRSSTTPKTTETKSTATSTRGGATGARSKVMDNRTPSKGDGAQGSSNNPQERSEWRGAYTVIKPDEKKRQQIMQQAKKEEDVYNRHKKSNKLGHVSHVGAVGGDGISQEEARKKQERDQRRAAIDRRQKAEQYRQQKKEEEDAIYEAKKMEQRKKAEANKKRDEDRNTSLKDEHRRRNLDFFDKKFGTPDKSAQGTESGTSPSDSKKKETKSQGTNTAADQCTSEISDLERLQSFFPTYDPDILSEILQQAGGSVEAAITLLS